MHQYLTPTRLISKVSQPKKVVVVVVLGLVLVVDVLVVVIVVVDPRNLPLKVGKNRVINRQDLIVVVAVLLLLLLIFCVVDSKNLPIKFRQNQVITAEISPTLCFWWVGAGPKSFSCQSQLLS